MATAGCSNDSRSHARDAQLGHPSIVSTNPCVDAILERVADSNQIISVSRYSQDPDASSSDIGWARRFASNDGTAEEVIALGPDTVLSGAHMSGSTTNAIKRAGIAIETVGVPSTVEQSVAEIRTVAKAVGHRDRGELLVAEIQGALRNAEPPKGPPVDAIVWQQEGLVPGEGTLVDALLSETGYRNMSAEYGLQSWDRLPLERLVAEPPQVIFTSVAGAKSLPIEHLEGSKVVVFPERLLFCAGPNIIEAARLFARERRDWRADAGGVS